MMGQIKQAFGLAGRLGLLLALVAGAALAEPAANPAGATLESLTTESDSGGALTNPLGARVEFASTDQSGAESSTPGGAWLYVGLFEPEPPSANAVKLWSLYE